MLLTNNTTDGFARGTLTTSSQASSSPGSARRHLGQKARPSDPGSESDPGEYRNTFRKRDQPVNEETLTIRGVQGPITVAIDEWGVPHIEAQSAKDVFFGQGFVTARNRMFQLDWWRRRGLGLVAEVLGAEYVERDRAARLFFISRRYAG
ncbi:penicillin acylase family protein [Arthrobacter sp. SD76]|uniref:penicillin acylase family protein n=1 Tax=Arthrobacter sp. SD76 TaxID=3415007 RepID=UPI003C71D26A